MTAQVIRCDPTSRKDTLSTHFPKTTGKPWVSCREGQGPLGSPIPTECLPAALRSRGDALRSSCVVDFHEQAGWIDSAFVTLVGSRGLWRRHSETCQELRFYSNSSEAP